MCRCQAGAAHRDVRDGREAEGIEAAVDIEEVEALQQHLLKHLRGCLPHGHARQAAAEEHK